MPTIAINSASHWVVIIGLCLSLFLGYEPHTSLTSEYSEAGRMPDT